MGMLSDGFGLPQIAAVLLLVQRGLEEVHSQRNTRRLLQQGAQEVGRDYYPVVAATHLAWIACLAFLVPSSAPVYVLPLIVFLALRPSGDGDRELRDRQAACIADERPLAECMSISD